jgi:uncharacterized membrane protein
MLAKFLTYNYYYFSKKRNESEFISWLFTIGIVSMGFAFNIAAVLFVIYIYSNPSNNIKNPGYVLVGMPWLILFIILYFNTNLKRSAKQRLDVKSYREYRLVYWVYFILTIIIYSYAMSYFSLNTDY